MKCYNVTLPNKVSGQVLEEALEMAAKDMGWGVTVKVTSSIDYNLGFNQARPTYSTLCHIIGNTIPALHVIAMGRTRKDDSLLVVRGLSNGSASQEKTLEYLNLVTEKIREIESPEQPAQNLESISVQES
ncbi:hypothetical protein GOV04_04550 [Candidatus Woesearchaeota archaeon]|nr:hypothetical protein [Candidatus Woesearchaeota archaeon]